jgi:spermidine synthase
MQNSQQKRSLVYLTAFLTAFATMVIEVSFTRLLSVIAYYYLAFFVVSVAMLGMTAGAVTVYIKQSWFGEKNIFSNLTKMAIAFALSIPVSVITVCFVPIGIEFSLMKLLGLAAIVFICAVPFYFSGIIIAVLLTRINLPTGKVYAADLAGASFGALFVLWGIGIYDAVGLIIITAVIAALIAFFFSFGVPGKKFKRISLAVVLVTLAISIVNSTAKNPVRPMVVKGHRESGSTYIYERWNSFSRVSVSPLRVGSPQYWGASPVAEEKNDCSQYSMTIDGDAGTVMRKFSVPADIEHLKYDLTSFACYLRNKGSACIIGLGGGKDVQSAILFGFDSVTGIDVNPVFPHLLEHEFREFAGIAGHPGVSLKTAEARSYLSQHKQTYDLIQMSLVDTWAATGAGAFSLSENNLYTVEAWKIFMKRLNPGGVFTVSRWYDPSDLAETGRMVSLAMTALFRLDKKEPSRHIAMVTHNNLATLMISNSPFTVNDIDSIRQKAGMLQFDPVLLPGNKPSNDILAAITGAGSEKELRNLLKTYPLNYLPPTDETPYFFNMLKLKNLNWKLMRNNGGVMAGNLQATIVLIVLIIFLALLSIVTIAIPLVIKTRQAGRVKNVLKQNRHGALYFSLIGAGFMLTEIALIQRLSVYLGHPVYALGILLFTIILSAGIGSFISAYINTQNKKWLILYPLIAAVVILLTKTGVSFALTNYIESDFNFKVWSSVLLIFPLGLLLGIFFPVGMRLAAKGNTIITPWFWGLNGIFGVLFSCLAVFISIYAGISVNFYLAAACYALVALVIKKISGPGTR